MNVEKTEHGYYAVSLRPEYPLNHKVLLNENEARELARLLHEALEAKE